MRTCFHILFHLCRSPGIHIWYLPVCFDFGEFFFRIYKNSMKDTCFLPRELSNAIRKLCFLPSQASWGSSGSQWLPTGTFFTLFILIVNVLEKSPTEPEGSSPCVKHTLTVMKGLRNNSVTLQLSVLVSYHYWYLYAHCHDTGHHLEGTHGLKPVQAHCSLQSLLFVQFLCFMWGWATCALPHTHPPVLLWLAHTDILC